VGLKVRELKNEYHERILMWCKEEQLNDGRKLTEVINKEHENVKYLPGQKLPENLIAVPELAEAVKDADILIFVIPHQYVKKTCEELKGKIKQDAFALTLIKVRRKRKMNQNLFAMIFFRDFMSMKKAMNSYWFLKLSKIH
jgi:glycerol-3-phosphate dehydrogenase (NAD+)